MHKFDPPWSSAHLHGWKDLDLDSNHPPSLPHYGVSVFFLTALCAFQRVAGGKKKNKASHFFHHHRKTCMEDNGFRPVSFRFKVFHFRWLFAPGGGHKMQAQQTWRPGLAQGISGNSTVCTGVSGPTSTLHYFF